MCLCDSAFWKGIMLMFWPLDVEVFASLKGLFLLPSSLLAGTQSPGIWIKQEELPKRRRTSPISMLFLSRKSLWITNVNIYLMILYFKFDFKKKWFVPAAICRIFSGITEVKAEQSLSSLLVVVLLNPFQQTWVNVKFQPPQHFSRPIRKVCAELC